MYQHLYEGIASGRLALRSTPSRCPRGKDTLEQALAGMLAEALGGQRSVAAKGATSRAPGRA